METENFKKNSMYVVESDFDFDGEKFKVGNMFKVLDNVKEPTGFDYITAEWKHELVHGYAIAGSGKDRHCWDIGIDLLIKHCRESSSTKDDKKQKTIVLKRFTKKEFKTVLKSLYEA